MGQRYERNKKNVLENRQTFEKLNTDRDTLQNEYAPLSLLDSIQSILDDETADAVQGVKAVGELEGQRIEAETDSAEKEKKRIVDTINSEITKLNEGLEKLRRANSIEFGKRAIEQSSQEYKKQIDKFSSLIKELGLHNAGGIHSEGITDNAGVIINDNVDENVTPSENRAQLHETEKSTFPTLTETQDRLTNEIGVGKADLSGFHPRVAQAMADALAEAKNDFPGLRVQYIGSIQSQVRSIESELVEFYRQKFASIENTGWSDELIDEAAHLNAKRFISAHRLNDTKGTFAWSLRIGASDPSNGGLAQYNGVAVNLDYASDYDSFKEAKVQNVRERFKPVGCDSPRATMDHELGHEIDRMLGASSDTKIIAWYNEMMASGKAKDLLSGYSTTNIAEFIAEAYSEYRNNPAPRQLSQKVYRRLLELNSLH